MNLAGLQRREGKMKRNDTGATRVWTPNPTTWLLFLIVSAILSDLALDGDAGPVSFDGMSMPSVMPSVAERMAVSGVFAAQASTPASAMVQSAMPSPEASKVSSTPLRDHAAKLEPAVQAEAKTAANSVPVDIVAVEARTVNEPKQVQSEAMASAGAAMAGAQGLQVTESFFVPPLVTTVGPQKATNGSVDLAFPLPNAGEGPLSSEMLRIIAKMTPEQIDALTLLLMSDGSSQPAGISPDGSVADAPWIGNWSDSEVAGDEAAEANGASDSALDPPWQMIEDADGSVFVEVPGDMFSRVRIEPALVLGSSGVVLDVKKTEGEVLVLLSDGRRILGPRNPAAVANEIAERTRAAERSKGDTRMEVVSAAIDVQADPPKALGRETAPGGAAEEVASAATPSTSITGQGWIQAGSFRDQSNAQKAEALLNSNGFEVVVLKGSTANGGWHVVRAKSKDRGKRASLEDIRALGFGDAYLIDLPGGTQE